MVFDKINSHHPEYMFHYNTLKDDIINWEGVNFPAGNRDIDRLEVNNGGLILGNVFDTTNIFLMKNKQSKQEQPKV